jgi:hypothetical protein
METSLHRELKRLYAGDDAQTEVRIGSFRIDAIVDGELVEIQHGSLAAIRDKVARLLVKHRVRIVKPIVASKILIKQAIEGGAIVSRRQSPKRGTLLDLFDEMVYFTRVFPHPRLTLEAVLVEIEQWSHPGHGRRRRWRRNDHVVSDQRLLAVGQTLRLSTAADLASLLPPGLPKQFHTGHLAALLEVRRHVAQRIAYCLRKMGACEAVGKQGNAWLYRVSRAAGKRVKTRAA